MSGDWSRSPAQKIQSAFVSTRSQYADLTTTSRRLCCGLNARTCSDVDEKLGTPPLTTPAEHPSSASGLDRQRSYQNEKTSAQAASAPTIAPSQTPAGAATMNVHVATWPEAAPTTVLPMFTSVDAPPMIASHVASDVGTC